MPYSMSAVQFYLCQHQRGYNGACRFPCHIVSTASTALSGSSARQDITALNFHSCSSAYLDFLRNALSQIVSSSTQLIISLSSTRGSICVNTKNNDQFYLDYMLLGMSLIIFIESKSNGKFYLDYLLRVSSKACFNKVQSIRHSFQYHFSTPRGPRRLDICMTHLPTVDNMQVQSLASTTRRTLAISKKRV